MKESFYLFTFESTHGAISSEKILEAVSPTIMPVPRGISTSCGIAIRVAPEKLDEAIDEFLSKTDLSPGEYALYYVEQEKDLHEFSAEPCDILSKTDSENN